MPDLNWTPRDAIVRAVRIARLCAKRETWPKIIDRES